MATQLYPVSVEQISTVKNQIERDLYESPAVDNAELFTSLHIMVLNGIENELTKFKFRRKAGETRAYKVGAKLEGTLGYIEENKIKVYTAWSRIAQPLEAFREREPLQRTTDGKYDAKNTELIIRNIGKQHSEDVAFNLFFGNRALGETSPIGLMDGYHTIIDKGINTGVISISNGNLIKCDPIVPQPAGQEVDNYEAFVAWVDGWNPKLKSADKVVVYMDSTRLRLIVDGCLKSYIGLQANVLPGIKGSSCVLPLYPNIELVANAFYGKGQRMVATVPENLRFANDSENSGNIADVMKSPEDASVVIFDLKTAQGVGIFDTNAQVFCVSDGDIKPIDGIIGDYQKAYIKASANDDTMGSVAISPVKDEYEYGETVTITPTAKAGYKFSKWSDEATANPRTIVFDGVPREYQAIFVTE